MLLTRIAIAIEKAITASNGQTLAATRRPLSLPASFKGSYATAQSGLLTISSAAIRATRRSNHPTVPGTIRRLPISPCTYFVPSEASTRATVPARRNLHLITRLLIGWNSMARPYILTGRTFSTRETRAVPASLSM